MRGLKHQLWLPLLPPPPRLALPPFLQGHQWLTCASNGTLALTLVDRILKGQTGYITSNF